MNFRQVLLMLLSLTVFAYTQAKEISINITYSNFSDSYVYPYLVRINGTKNVIGELLGCSNGPGTGSLITTYLYTPPRYIEVTWEHLLTRKVYKARINLSDKAGEWWRKTPFRGPDGKPFPRRPDLVIQWRGPQKVAAMLVATSNDFTLGQIDLGIAKGKETERPNWGPKLYLGYPDYQKKTGDRYRIGRVTNYNRIDDPTLPNEQRYGCPRLSDGRLDTSRLPPQKLPFITGPNGEHIPCAEYFCRDKQDLIRKLRKLGWREYQDGQDIPVIEFGESPNPEPAR